MITACSEGRRRSALEDESKSVSAVPHLVRDTELEGCFEALMNRAFGLEPKPSNPANHTRVRWCQSHKTSLKCRIALEEQPRRRSEIRIVDATGESGVN